MTAQEKDHVESMRLRWRDDLANRMSYSPDTDPGGTRMLERLIGELTTALDENVQQGLTPPLDPEPVLLHEQTATLTARLQEPDGYRVVMRVGWPMEVRDAVALFDWANEHWPGAALRPNV